LKKSIYLFLFLSLISFSSSFANEKCKPACDKFLDCTKEMNQGKSATAADIKKLTDGCMNTCKKKTKEVLACFATSANTCVNFALCIQKSYQTSKN
jgi:Cys-rich protein (TIGR04453 family)